MSLSEQLRQVEWYDNHKLSNILACRYYSYLNTIYRGGLTAGVGDGANFGTVQHAARAVYYDGKKKGLNEHERRDAAFAKYASEYERLFGKGVGAARKHSFDNGLDLLDCYFDNYLFEDDQWEPIETELAAVVEIKPADGDPPRFREPFYYVIRCDGLWLRVANGDLFVNEFKTTGGGVDREITRRAIDRQTTGYTYGIKQFPDGEKVVGVFLDVMGVTVEKRDFRREVYMKSDRDLATWRLQTIEIVEDWRECKRRVAEGEAPKVVMYQNDQHCTSYGLCPFWKGCYHSIVMLDDLPVNEWTPFNVQ